MAISRVVLECPFCSEIFEAESPDKLRTAYSVEKPIASSYPGDVVKKKQECQNRECKKPITIYWYSPMNYSTECE